MKMSRQAIDCDRIW